MVERRSNFNLDDYVTVQDRINQFWTDHANGRIMTTLESPRDDFSRCRYRADVYRDAQDGVPAASGYAFEIAGEGYVNKTSHEENCETSAIGRALANLGYATSHAERPSREEMAKVQRMQEAPTAMRPTPEQYERTARATSPPVRGGNVEPIRPEEMPQVAPGLGPMTGTAPFGLKWTTLIGHLNSAGWQFIEGARKETVIDEVEQWGEETRRGKIRGSARDGSIYPSDVWNYVVREPNG